MELYKYYVFFGEFKKVKYYVLEKAKTFVTKDGRRRFKKMDIETIVDSVGNVAFLTLFDDDERASKELMRFYKNQQKFVANYIEKYKEELSVREAMSKSYATFEVDKWLAELDEDGNFINQNTFAIAWIFGYEVEKEKRYRVKLKNADISYSLLKCNTEGEWWFGVDFDEDSHAHTRKQLEEAGFGEVFNSQLFEVKEVEG